MGDKAKLICDAGESNPTATITWFRNGREVRGGQKIVKQGDHGGYLLTQEYQLNGGNPISSLDNGAKYSCSVSNPAISGNTVTKEYFLNVRCKIPLIYSVIQ